MAYELHGWQEGTLLENLVAAGVSRRSFLQYCGTVAALMTVSSAAGAQAAPTPELIAQKLGELTKPNVVWLQLQECTGCMESTIRAGGTTVEEVVLSLLSVNYNELVMAASGASAEQALHDTNAEDHILVVNGSVPMKDGGIYCTIGGKSAEQVLRESAEKATAILAVGACAVYGSVQAAKPNPTGAVGVDEIIKNKPVINVAGCPPIGEVITATVAYILTLGKLPKTDAQGRPLFAYGQRIHDSCPRPGALRRRAVRAYLRRRGGPSGLVSLRRGVQGSEHVQPVPHHAMEPADQLADRCRAPLHRLHREGLLRPLHPLLHTPARVARSGYREHRAEGRLGNHRGRDRRCRDPRSRHRRPIGGRQTRGVDRAAERLRRRGSRPSSGARHLRRSRNQRHAGKG